MFIHTVYEDLLPTTVFMGSNHVFFPLLNSMAALVIQAHWRGYMVRRQINFSTRLHTAAVEPLTFQPNDCIKNKTILKEEKRENTVNIQEQREKAAILIQVSFNLLVK